MATVAELVPGDLVRLPGSDQEGVFFQRCRHPVWPYLMLVIWRLGGEWVLDALALNQETGDVVPSTQADRKARLENIIFGRRCPDR